MARSIHLENIDLAAPPYLIHTSNVWGSSRNAITAPARGRERGSAVVLDRIEARSIQLTGVILANDGVAAETALDGLKQLISHREVELQVGGYSDGTRSWICHVVDVPTPNRTGRDISRIPFTINLLCPAGLATSQTTANLFTPVTGFTLSSQTIDVTVTGSYAALPEIVLAFTAVSPTNNKISIQLSNTALHETLNIDTILSAGDTISVNSVTNTTTLNSDKIETRGPYPRFGLTGEGLAISDSASTRSYNVSALYRPRWY